MKVEVMAGLASESEVRVKAHQVAFSGCDLQVLTLEPDTSPVASLSPSPPEKTFEKTFLSQYSTSPTLHY